MTLKINTSKDALKYIGKPECVEEFDLEKVPTNKTLDNRRKIGFGLPELPDETEIVPDNIEIESSKIEDKSWAVNKKEKLEKQAYIPSIKNHYNISSLIDSGQTVLYDTFSKIGRVHQRRIELLESEAEEVFNHKIRNGTSKWLVPVKVPHCEKIAIFKVSLDIQDGYFVPIKTIKTSTGEELPLEKSAIIDYVNSKQYQPDKLESSDRISENESWPMWKAIWSFAPGETGSGSKDDKAPSSSNTGRKSFKFREHPQVKKNEDNPERNLLK